MSLGGSIPYHLRQNKAIERALFIDLLSRVGRYRNISDYTYVGFGGPFLEDFKIIHSALRINKMVSLEMDKNVAARQAFNKPLSCIDPRHETSGEFLTNYVFSGPHVVWLDYAMPRFLSEQLGEARSLVSKLTAGDVFKITLNANPQQLGAPQGDADLKEHRAKTAAERLGEYGPAVIDPDDVAAGSFPQLLLQALLNACKKGVEGANGLVVQPLCSFVYKDGQVMLTATGMLLEHEEQENFFSLSRIDHWPFSSLDWAEPKQISIPDLSAKERLHIESCLPGGDVAQIMETMGYYVGESKDDAKLLMENFVQYYRLSPHYSRVIM